VFTLAWSLGGTISGEHAVGLVRAAFLRRQYGDAFYDLLCKIKKIFDPDGLLNPGKIISDEADVMTKNLKARHQISPTRSFAESGVIFTGDEISLELEQCNGCGVCRSKEERFRMCPVFRAAGEELASSRAKMNVLRFWATGQMEEADFDSPEFRKFLDLCINCRACSIECPSGVDVSKIMAAARAEYVRRKGLRLSERLLAKNRYLSLLGSIFAPISNFVMRLEITRKFLEKTIGLDRRRRIPRFAFGPFVAEGNAYLLTCRPSEMPIDKVAYFVDSYVNYNDHELGFAVIDVLRHHEIEVILPRQRPAPLPAIVYGDVQTAKKDLSYSVRYLARAARDGYKIICSEPSAAMCLKHELRHYVDNEDARLVSANTYELMEYLRDLSHQDHLKKAPGFILGVNPQHKVGGSRSDENRYVYHMPCHLFAMNLYGASIEVLKQIAGLDVVDLKAGCCGLAGTFGMQKKNYELSEAIAKSLKDALDKTPAKYVLTECAACGLQIEHLSGKPTIHPIKILAQAYGLI
jgi:Fe-S oxidoreductase